MRRVSGRLILGGFVLSAAMIACSSGGSDGSGGKGGKGGSKPAGTCNTDPFSCPAGQTCWINSNSAFACLNSGPGKEGDACQNIIGSPTCGDGLACYAVGSPNGTCMPFCDPSSSAHACPN